MVHIYGSPEGALSNAEQQLQSNPELMHRVLGYLYFRSGQYDAAIESFKRSGTLLDQMETGLSALAAGQYALADESFARVLDEAPETVEAGGGRCLALNYSGNLEAASAFCEEAARRAPNDARYLMAYADILSARQRYGEALSYYQKALSAGERRAAPKLADAYYRLGQAAVASGLTGDAIQLFSKAILLNGNEKNYHVNIGAMFLRQRRFREALAAFDAALRLDPNSSEALASKGICAAALGEKEMARVAFVRALDINANMSLALDGYCALLRSLGENSDEICARAQKRPV
jgi:tetratricopeptide (TPR) repeat protein